MVGYSSNKSSSMATHRRHRDEDLDSEFEYASESKRKRWSDDPLAFQKPEHASSSSSSSSRHSASVPSKRLAASERDKEEWRTRRFHLLSMDAYSRHKALVNQYVLSCGKGIEHFARDPEGDRNDYSVLRERHRFLWGDSERADTWEERLAKAYYDRLFKEYAIGDLSRYRENRFAMRWRTEKEVLEGKGQFVCGSKRCEERDALESWEVNFAYEEHGERKNALVKLRLCPRCSKKLNYHHKRRPWKDRSRKGTDNSSSDGRKASAVDKHKRKHSRRDRKTRNKEGAEKRKSDKYEWKEKSSASSESSERDSGSSDQSESEEEAASKASAVWSKPAEAFLEKSQEEEFDDYFKDMLL